MSNSSPVPRPKRQHLVVTKINEAPIPDEEFRRRLAALKEFQTAAGEASSIAAAALIRYAVEYAALCVEVEGNTSRLRQLNRELNLPEHAATRLRTIASQAVVLTEIESSLPPTLEQIYEVTLAVKKDADAVRQAAAGRLLKNNSTCKEIRGIKALASIRPRQTTRSKRRPARLTARQVWEGKRFLKGIMSVVPRDGAVWFRMQADPQWYGTTVICTFIATNVKPSEDGGLPQDMDPRFSRAVRMVLAPRQ